MKIITAGGPFPGRYSEVPDWLDDTGRSPAGVMLGQGPRTGAEIWYVDSGVLNDDGVRIFWPAD